MSEIRPARKFINYIEAQDWGSAIDTLNDINLNDERPDLFNRSQPKTLLGFVIMNYKTSILEKIIPPMLEKGADPTNKVHVDDITGAYPIHRAAANGEPSIIKLFLQKGADINSHCDSNTQDLTPIGHASMNLHADTVRFLLRKGADPSVSIRYRRNQVLTPAEVPYALSEQAPKSLEPDPEKRALTVYPLLIAGGAMSHPRFIEQVINDLRKIGNPDTKLITKISTNAL